MGFKLNIGQARVLDFIKRFKYILVASGSRCFAKDTLVQTATGHKAIQDIKVGEYVLSTNLKANKQEYKKVLKTFHNSTEQSKQMVILVLKDGRHIDCTQQHEIYKENAFTPAIDIAKRAMESGKWNKRSLSGKQFGKVEDIQLEGYKRRSRDEARTGCQRVPKNNDKERGRQISHDQNASLDSATLDRESREQAGGEPHQQQSSGQSCREFGMGNTPREFKTHDGSGSPNFQQRGKERHGYNDGGPGTSNQERIRSGKRVDAPSMVRTLRSEALRNVRYASGSDMEAREIDYNEIVEIYFYSAKVETFDLCVQDNRNYTVTEDNIIVHNSGKTFIILYAMITIASLFPRSRQLIARKFFSHVKGSIWLDTLPKVLDLCFPRLKDHIKWNNTDYYITLPNGSEIFCVGLDDKQRVDKILGREYLNIFFNECSEISYDSYTTVLSRLAQRCERVNSRGETVQAKNKVFADENPTTAKHWSKVLFVDKKDPESVNKSINNPEEYGFTFIHPSENEANISQDYIKMLENMPPAKRKRFLDGVFAESSANALWDDEIINRYRVSENVPYKRIIVAVDPAVTSTDTSDETGIIAAGISWDNEMYVLDDQTGTYTPNEWANKVVETYNKWNADRVVAEVNQGGEMVEALLRSVAPNIPYSGVWAVRNKVTRAEPLSALYYQGKVHHVGIFTELELEQTGWEAKKGDKSPNRIDSLVWAGADLFPELGINKKMSGSFAKAMRG